MVQRIAFYDNVKFILIVMVIYCHLINVGFAVPWKAYQIIYSFHMPLFIIISGYFTNKFTDKIKFWDSTLNLLVLFILFNFVTIYIYIYLCDEPPVKPPYIPSFALWYILCMIYWRIMIRFVPVKILESKIFFTLVLAFSIIPSLVNVNYLAFSRFISFMPFFLLGYNFRNVDMLNWINGMSKKYKILIVFLAIPACYAATKVPIGIFWAHQPLELPAFKIVSYKIIAWVIAIINSLALCIVIPRKINFEDGKHTLTYYLFHTIVLYPVLLYLCDFFPSNWLLTLIVLLVVLAVLHYVSKSSWINKILGVKPITIYLKIKNKANN